MGAYINAPDANAPVAPDVGFIYVPTPMTFGEAEAYCLENYQSNLATVYTDDIAEAIGKIDYDGTATWIGLYSSGPDGNWLWRNGDECEYPSPAACINYWGTPQENGINVPLCVKDGTGNLCGYIKNGLAFNDLECDQERPFLCDTQATSIDGIKGTCPCIPEITDTCNSDGYISFKCKEDPSISFGQNVEVLQSCINIDSDIIPDGIIVTDAIVSTKFQHEWVGDLFGWLQRPGTDVLLFDAISYVHLLESTNNKNADVTFSDDGPLQAYDDIYDPKNGFALGGDRFPVESLSTFDGTQANGLWAFSIIDNVPKSWFLPYGSTGTFGEWELKLGLSQCPTNSAKSINNDGGGNNNDLFNFEDILGDNINDKYTFIEIIGLNAIVSIFATLLVIIMVYCVCCRSKNKLSKGYGPIDPELNEDDELPIKENI